jgi:nitrous oxide reductase accessory protein NosL
MNKSLLMAALVAAVALAACGKKEEAAPATAPTVATPAPAPAASEAASAPMGAASPAMAASQ